MRKVLTKKVMLCALMLILLLTLQGCSFAKEENVQLIKKSENEYIIYVNGLLNEEFEFAFSNAEDVDKKSLSFTKSALDKDENGNNIAYIDSNLYNQYFYNKEETFIWAKINEDYKLEAEKLELEKALSEEDIQDLNKVTKKIEVKVGEKELPEKNVDGVSINHKIGTLNIVNSENGKYSYKMVKVSEGTDTVKLIELANKMNDLEEKNIFEQLSLYGEFKEIYTKLKPKENDNDWKEVQEATIEQPQEAKKGEQYLVWIKQEKENDTVIDLQIMTCQDEYKPEYEKKEVVIKETTKLPVLGDDLTLFIIAGIIIVLITVVIILKVKNNKIDGKHMGNKK